MFRAIHLELLFTLTQKMRQTQKKSVIECFWVKLAFSIQVYWSETLRWVFSLESLISSFDGFSKIAIIYGILANNWSFGKFSEHGLHIMQVKRNAKQLIADVVQNSYS